MEIAPLVALFADTLRRGPPPGSTGSWNDLLIVEDDVASLGALRRLLSVSNLSVRTATSVHEAMDRIHERRPGVLLCDIYLLDGTGLDIVREIRGHELQGAPRVLAIAMTGSGEHREQPRAFAAGFDALLRKPIAVPRLLSMLTSWFRGRPHE